MGRLEGVERSLEALYLREKQGIKRLKLKKETYRNRRESVSENPNALRRDTLNKEISFHFNCTTQCSST